MDGGDWDELLCEMLLLLLWLLFGWWQLVQKFVFLLLLWRMISVEPIWSWRRRRAKDVAMDHHFRMLLLLHHWRMCDDDDFVSFFPYGWNGAVKMKECKRESEIGNVGWSLV